MQITGKLALVTGASSGIGEATAKALAQEGARVVLLARNEERLRRVAGAIAAAGGSESVYPVDLADADQVAQVAERIRAELGVPDIIVNNAGAGRWMPLVETSSQEARHMIEAPYLAGFYLTREFLPQMVERGSGCLVSVTSPASFMVWPNACGYIAARHAVRGFADALRFELRGSGVGVSVVVLGLVASPYWKHNPGSREHVPKMIPWLMPTLTTDQAAAQIVKAIKKNKRQVVAPPVFKWLFAMQALFPRLTERMVGLLVR